jgi:hypothetical protein
MQRSMFRLILASVLSMAVSVALSADLSRWGHEDVYVSQDQAGCSCDAPGSSVWFARPPIGARKWMASAWGAASRP